VRFRPADPFSEVLLIWIGGLAVTHGRLPPNPSAVAVAVLLGAIEVIQIHLPGRVAEITDPLLAVLLAITLGLLDRSERLSSDSLTKVRTCDAELPAVNMRFGLVCSQGQSNTCPSSVPLISVRSVRAALMLLALMSPLAPTRGCYCNAPSAGKLLASAMLVIALVGTVILSGCVGLATRIGGASSVNPLQITTTSLMSTKVGTQFQADLTAAGGVQPYRWSVASGVWPPELSLNSNSGAISGTASQSGQFDFSIQVSDSSSPTPQIAVKSMILSVVLALPASPALPTLPQATVDLTMPTQTGTVWNVPAGDAATLQSDINSANCGDTIVLVAGSTYTGNFTIPNKVCSGWILIESSALASLPASNHRVASSNAPNMAKVSTPNTSPAIEFLANSNHWRLIGLEITTSYVSTINTVYNLVLSDGSSASSLATMPSFVIFDRIYIHGLSTTNTTRGIDMDFASAAVVDSDCDEIHYNGNDSQCFYSSNGPGPFVIQNNFIQAGAENIMFGGAAPSIPNIVPSDITIVGNLFQKNLTWRGQAAPYNWVVKNLFELKSAQRVLLDGNVLQYTWAAGQAEAIIIRSVNSEKICTWCEVQDVTVTHNLIQHAPTGLVITGWDTTDPSLATARISVQNNILDDISAANWGGHGWAIELSSGNIPYMHDVIIDHNTAFPDTAFIFIDGNGIGGTTSNTQFTNNISNLGSYGIIGDGTGSGTVALSTFAPGYIYNDIVFIGSAGGTYPAGTFWNTSGGVEFTNFAGANYQLTTTSTYHNAGTDGKDIGVWDWTTFNTETTNAVSGNYSH
jgi:hypothetical protein